MLTFEEIADFFEKSKWYVLNVKNRAIDNLSVILERNQKIRIGEVGEFDAKKQSP